MSNPESLFTKESSARYEPDECRKLQFGPLDLFVSRGTADWYIGVTQHGEGLEQRWTSEQVDRPVDVKWKRFAVKAEQFSVRVDPALPPRPVVVRPESPYRILPGERITFFVAIPMWIRISTPTAEPATMTEEPTRILSKTWHGVPTEGELGFAMRSRARRILKNLEPYPYRIICPVRLRNAYEEALDLERLCIRVQHLRIYSAATRYWTNEVGITYQGPNLWSRMAIGKTPTHEPVDAIFREAREASSGKLQVQSLFNAWVGG